LVVVVVFHRFFEKKKTQKKFHSFLLVCYVANCVMNFFFAKKFDSFSLVEEGAVVVFFFLRDVASARKRVRRAGP
jgi:hypothetical protein